MSGTAGGRIGVRLWAGQTAANDANRNEVRKSRAITIFGLLVCHGSAGTMKKRDRCGMNRDF